VSTDLRALEANYRRRKLEIRETPGLSWEKKELAIKALSEEHYERLRELEDREGAA